jgi:cbb3-type cytochrome oxidase maturation protein
MEVLTLQVFVSLMLVVSSLVLFWFSVRQRDHQHAGRLALLPLDDEAERISHNPTPSERNG